MSEGQVYEQPDYNTAAYGSYGQDAQQQYSQYYNTSTSGAAPAVTSSNNGQQYTRGYSYADPSTQGATSQQRDVDIGTSYYRDPQGNVVFEAPPQEMQNLGGSGSWGSSGNYGQPAGGEYQYTQAAGTNNTNPNNLYVQEYAAYQDTNVPLASDAPQPTADVAEDVSCTQAWRNVFVTIGTSIPFKVYILLHFYAAWIFVTLLGLNAFYTCIYRMYSLPSYTIAPFWQSMAYFTILIELHFFVAAVLTMIQEYGRDFWSVQPGDDLLWGINRSTIEHWWIYMTMFTVYVVLPFFWSIVYTATNNRNVIYFLEFYFFVSMMITLVHYTLGYIWMYWRALKEKRRAFRHRHRFAVEVGSPTPVKIHWYQNPLVMKQYGMDIPTLNATMVFTFFGFILHLMLSIALAIDGLPQEKNNPSWIGVGLSYFILIFFMREMANSKRWYRVGLVCISCLGIYIILALASCGVSGGSLIAVWLVLMAATQGMCLRKRDYFSREEPDGDTLTLQDDKARIDPYLCCCQSGLRACFLTMFDGWFGTPMTNDERIRTNRIRILRRSLWSDLKTLNNLLLFFSFCIVLLLIFGRQLRTDIRTSIAAVQGNPLLNTNPGGVPDTVCSWVPFPNMSYTLMDVAYLTALTYSDGTVIDKDFKIWFGYNTNMTRIYPLTVSNDNDISGSVNVNWIDFFDYTTNTHFIVIRSFSVATSWMRDIDTWGDSVVYQLASIAIPFVSSWPTELRSDFVSSMAFLKTWFGGANVTDPVESYIHSVRKEGHSVVVSGHGTNGGYAKIVAARLGLRVAAFNAPGTRLLAQKFDMGDNTANEITISTDHDFLAYLDEPNGATYALPCAATVSETKCGDVLNTVNTLLYSCGDIHGRTVNL